MFIKVKFNFQVLTNKSTLIVLLLFITALTANSQNGLHFSEEELSIWRQRSGIENPSIMYKSRGDVQSNSPSDWDRILSDALSAVSNSANDRYTNYDVTKGLDQPITELNSGGFPQAWPARTPFIDDKEPRPGINRKDFGALSILHAGFVHLLIGGDQGSISGTSGRDFANAVKTELLWYAQNPWLDFTNRNRWSINDPFFDRNPGFFIACWLNSLLNAYDYTKESNVYSAGEKQAIEEWLFEASRFYHDMMTKVISGVFRGYTDKNYGDVPTGGWIDRNIGSAWDGSNFQSYGLNEYFSNRSASIWRFIMRSGIFFKDNNNYNITATKHINSAHQWTKLWMTYGTFADGTFTDFHRAKSYDPQKGLYYSIIAIGAIIDLVDAYERHMKDAANFESLYEWELTPGTAEYEQLLPSSTKGRGWRRSIELSSPKGLKKILITHLKHFDGSYGNSRTVGGFPINGYSAPSGAPIKNVDTDRWMALANIYYKDDYIKSIYTRSKSGLRPYESNPTRAGSYDINNGSWGAHPGTLFMFGQMEGIVWPYEDGKTSQTLSFPNIEDRFLSDGAFELSASASSGLPVSFEVVSGPAFINGNVINFTSEGEVVVRAYQQGDDAFRAVAATNSFVIKKKIGINAVENQIVKGGNILEVDVTLDYGGTDLATLVLTAQSDDESLIANSNITVSGSGTQWKLQIQPPQGVEGNVKITLNSTDGIAEADEVSFDVLVGEFTSSTMRIDAGLVSGETVYDNKVFQPLLPFLIDGDGRNSLEVHPIANTTYDELYHRETWGRSTVTKYSFPVDQGEYSIHLHFSDWHYNNPGDRVMDILLENEIVLDDFDIIDEVGKSAAYIKSFDRVLMDGNLELEIRNINGFSQISAIEILPKGTPSIAVDKPDALNQVISFNSLGSVTIQDSPITLQASASSGLPVEFELISGPASLVGNQLTLDQLGVVTVKASQQGDETYLPADDVIRTFRITEKLTMPQLSDRIITKNTILGPLKMNISYSGDINNLNITATSENKALIPDENIVLKREGNDFVLTLTPSTDLTGVSNISIEISDNTFASLNRSFNVLVEEGINTVGSLRLDAGLNSGESFYEEKRFEPLIPYLTNGTPYSTYAYWSEDIQNTNNDGLYQTELWWEKDSTVNFEFPLEPGEYTVHLHFIDLYDTRIDEKLLDVKLQNVTVLNNYDIILEAGNEQAVIKSFDITIAKGNLSLSMFGELGFNQISGIEILPKGELPLKITTPINVINNIPVISDIDEPLIQEGATAEVLVKATDLDNEPITLSIENLPSFSRFTDNGNGEGSIIVSPGFEDEGIYTPILIAKDNRNGESRLEFTIEVVDLPVELKITSFILVNADTEEEIGQLNNGDTIKYAEIGTSNINIKAEVDESVIDRVDFSINEINTTAESQPFNLFDSNSSNLKSFSVIGGEGIHYLEATPIKLLSPGSTGEERSIKGDKTTVEFYLDTKIPDFELDVYPNPSEEIFNLKLNRWSEKGMFMALYDASGKVYLERELDVTERNNLELWLNDVQYKAGIYLLKVFSGDGSITALQRIMKITR